MGVGTQLDLKIIDETYGKSADLYEDVLRVPNTATHDEIQLAYFDRRSELFTLLAKIDAAARGPQNELSSSLASVDQRRYMAEKKMDSVVFAVRVLADPALRNAYNKVRSERTGMATKSKGFTLKESPSGATAASESSTKNSKLGKKPDPPAVHTSQSSDSKNWIQSTFSGSLFSNLSSKDDSDEAGDEDRNPRKARRRQKQLQSSSSPSRDDPAQESEGGKEKRSIWGRKKRKKKKEGKELALNDSMETNLTDTSMTDQEDGDDKNMTRDSRNVIVVSESSESTTDPDFRPQPADRRDIVETETVEDDDTRTYDDARTYDNETLATGSVISNTDDIQRKGTCGGDGMFGCISGSRVFKSIATEVSGACEDTLVSVDQVFNAFTLTDKDIKAVKKKIDKAKKQLDS